MCARASLRVRCVVSALGVATSLVAGQSFADPPDSNVGAPASDQSTGTAVPVVSPDAMPRTQENDPTGGAYTTPTLLFIPAAAVPVWNVRVIASLDVQGPTGTDRLAHGTSVGFQPGIGGELGLPAGFTFGAGTTWVGGDVSPAPVSDGLSPYFQLRYHILGDTNGQGFQLGTSVTYKFVGFDGDPGEMELAVSAQYRRARYEVGLQAVVGKDFGSEDADGELHAYALYRPLKELGIGAAGQVRYGFVAEPDESKYDVVAGALASLTLGRWQIAGLGGVSTIGLDQGHAGALGELFATVRF